MRTQSDRDTYIRIKSKGFTLTQCSLALGVSKRTLQRWNKSSIQSRPLARIHLRKLAHEHTAFILIYIDHSPTTTIRELRTIIRQRFTVNVSKDTIWRFLHASNLTHKKATKRYTEANPECQQLSYRCYVPIHHFASSLSTRLHSFSTTVAGIHGLRRVRGLWYPDQESEVR